MGQTSAERVAAYRARQKAAGKKPWSVIVTEDEAFLLERVLLSIRETGATPCAGRDPKTGRFIGIDI